MDKFTILEVLKKALKCVEIQNMHSYYECETIEDAIALGYWCQLAIDTRSELKEAISSLEGKENLTVLVLNDYQASNLKAVIEASGVNFWRVIQNDGIEDNPLSVLNTGDWIGEIYWMLPSVINNKPNIDPLDMIKASINNFRTHLKYKGELSD